MSLMDRDCRLWYILILIRLLVIFLPQTGYLHPDEFFQTVEIVAGDVLEVKHLRTWEFSSAIRSIVPPYMIAAPLFYLQNVAMSCLPFFNSSYLTLILPRIVMFLCSLVVDYSVLFIAASEGLDQSSASMIMASSYISMVYLTRTFTNSAETVLFAVLLILIYKQKHRLNKTKRKECNDKEKYTAKTYERKSLEQFRRDANKTAGKSEEFFLHTNQSLLNVFILGVVYSVGFFTRPTFLFFAFIPVLMWLYQSMTTMKSAVAVIVGMTLGVTMTFGVFVIADSVYYRNLDISSLMVESIRCYINMADSSCHRLESIFSSITITPWNFIRYNTNKDNLSQHGLHPRYLHVLVNLPLLFGPLLFPVLFASIQSLVSRNKDTRMQIFTLYLTVPLMFLSIFPHQEPRFLLPLLPLVVLISTSQLGSSSYRKLIMITWVVFNISMSLVYGVLHQGGVIPSLLHIQRHMTNVSVQAESSEASQFTFKDKFVYYHTYMPPRHFLLTKEEQIVDLQGQSMKELEDTIHQLRNSTKDDNHKQSVYVLMPGTLVSNVSFTYSVQQMFTPHLSLEDPIRLPPLPVRLSFSTITSYMSNLRQQLSLSMLKVL